MKFDGDNYMNHSTFAKKLQIIFQPSWKLVWCNVVYHVQAVVQKLLRSEVFVFCVRSKYLHRYCSRCGHDLGITSYKRAQCSFWGLRGGPGAFPDKAWWLHRLCGEGGLWPSKGWNILLWLHGHAVASTDSFSFMVLRRLWVLQSKKKRCSVDGRICT